MDAAYLGALNLLLWALPNDPDMPHLAALLDSVMNNDRNQPAYPPYNIELIDKDQYRITMAVAGFTEVVGLGPVAGRLANCARTSPARCYRSRNLLVMSASQDCNLAVKDCGDT